MSTREKMNPFARAKEKDQIIFDWLWRWLVIDAAVVQTLLQIKQRQAQQTLRNLHAKKLLEVVPQPLPVRVFCLSRAGRQYARQLLAADEYSAFMVEWKYPLPSRIPIRCIRHDLIAANIAAKLLEKEVAYDVFSPRDFAHHYPDGIHPGLKVPDVYAFTEKGAPAIYEIQEYLEPPARRKKTLRFAADALASSNNELAKVVTVSSKPGLLKLFRETLAAGLPKYERYEGRWVPVGHAQNGRVVIPEPRVPEGVQAMFGFKLLPPGMYLRYDGGNPYG